MNKAEFSPSPGVYNEIITSKSTMADKLILEMLVVLQCTWMKITRFVLVFYLHLILILGNMKLYQISYLSIHHLFMYMFMYMYMYVYVYVYVMFVQW